MSNFTRVENFGNGEWRESVCGESRAVWRGVVETVWGIFRRIHRTLVGGAVYKGQRRSSFGDGFVVFDE